MDPSYSPETGARRKACIDWTAVIEVARSIASFIFPTQTRRIALDIVGHNRLGRYRKAAASEVPSGFMVKREDYRSSLQMFAGDGRMAVSR